MEKLLKELFALQRFAHDPALQALIDDTECRWGEDITDEEAARLAAAGDPTDGRRLPAPEDLRQ